MSDLIPPADDNQIIAERREKLARLRESGPAFPNDFERLHYAGDLQSQYGDLDKAELEGKGIEVAAPVAVDREREKQKTLGEQQAKVRTLLESLQ